MNKPVLKTRLHDMRAGIAGLGSRTSFILGGSWVVISRLTSPLIWVITIVTLIITPLITTHEPPSMFSGVTLDLLCAASQTELRNQRRGKQHCLATIYNMQ